MYAYRGTISNACHRTLSGLRAVVFKTREKSKKSDPPLQEGRRPMRWIAVRYRENFCVLRLLYGERRTTPEDTCDQTANVSGRTRRRIDLNFRFPTSYFMTLQYAERQNLCLRRNKNERYQRTHARVSPHFKL